MQQMSVVYFMHRLPKTGSGFSASGSTMIEQTGAASHLRNPRVPFAEWGWGEA